MALNYVLLALFMAYAFTTSAARELLPKQPTPGLNLAARLEANNGNIIDCWNALTEIKSCANEIVMFFTNGTADIGPPCCQAIKTITHQCWTDMLIPVGFTPEESNILSGYCDAYSGPAPSPTVQSPVPVSATTMVKYEQTSLF